MAKILTMHEHGLHFAKQDIKKNAKVIDTRGRRILVVDK
jgi:hypothetical protein